MWTRKIAGTASALQMRGEGDYVTKSRRRKAAIREQQQITGRSYVETAATTLSSSGVDDEAQTKGSDYVSNPEGWDSVEGGVDWPPGVEIG